MSRGMGRAERWLLSWLTEQKGNQQWFAYWIGEQYAKATKQEQASATASVRRAAHRLARLGQVEIGYGQPDSLSRPRSRRALWVGAVGSCKAAERRYQRWRKKHGLD